jgi:hypothetical protein
MDLRRAAGVVALVGAVTSAVWFTFESPATGIDDANIFLAYARNVSAGEGFVFNAGGERVEGFTSLLWVLASTGAVTLSDAPERLLLALNVLLLSFSVGLCLRSSVCTDEKGAPSWPWATVFLVALLSDFFFVAWNTVTLMETALWTALLTSGALAAVDVDRRPIGTWPFAVVIALLVVTRPEALLWAPALVGLVYVRRAEFSNHREALRSALPAMLAYGLTAVSLTMFRLVYFGYPLPNTYYAKVSPSILYRLEEGTKYLWSYVTSAPVPLLCTATIILSFFHLARVRFRDTRTLALNTVALLGLAIPVLSGGDHFDGYRFYQSIYPLLLLNFLNFARFVAPALKNTARPAYVGRVLLFGPAASAHLAALALVVGLFISLRIVEWRYVDYRAVLGYEFDIARIGRMRGNEANLLFDDLETRPSIATITVGGLKYRYGGDVVDLMGLNNTRMAHNGGDRIGVRSHAAFDKATFFALSPTMVVPLVQFSDGLSAIDAKNSPSGAMVALILKGLLQDPKFRKKYQVAEVRKWTPDGTVSLAAWYERKFLSKLTRSGNFEIVANP